MIRKTVKLKHRRLAVYAGDSRMHRYLVTTWWLLFIPIFVSENLVELP